ncbi:heavy metal-associated domain-containing protein [Algibacter sp. 2305UL17-15]|uniref:heavy-metal-associated domain-containing protein n=1 Tax=Algibacter sp. 2305UL17-15 TaxID=3231268 RepID=UPI00345B487F
MKTIKYILGITLVTLLVVSCKNETKPEVKTVEVESTSETKELDPNATYAKAEFTVEGMTCAIGCAASIEKKIAKMEGVKFAKVDFDKKLAMVEYDEAKVNPESLENTVTSVADLYKVSDMKTVEDFSATKTCAANCKKACCAKDKAKKTACKADCKKECCAKKA